MNDILSWMAGTWINALVLDYTWSWPTLEILHFTGMCVLFGSILIMDLRLLGLQKFVPPDALHQLVPFAVAGFGMNFITGIIFFFGQPFRYAINISFQLKMALVVLACFNALLYRYKIEPMVRATEAGGDFPFIAKAVALVSVVLWLGVISFGRLIPYLGTG